MPSSDAGQGAVHFITMELVEGRTLAELTPRDGLPLEPLLALAIPLAEALASAHDRGIVHRDLKPSNVMVTDEGGRLKVLDFGLAKALDQASGIREQGAESEEERRMGEAPTVTSPNLTALGSVLGTAAYMSPEQARGGAVDHRTDVFSLGVVLFELATGARPFRGTGAIELMSAILKDPAPSVRAARPDLPPQLGQVLERCLEKAPPDRYQTARDVYHALRALHATAATEPSSRPVASSDAALRRSQAEAPWIAVMPFDCQADDAELRDVAAGLTEDLTTGLARFSYLLVISRNSTLTLERADRSTCARSARSSAPASCWKDRCAEAGRGSA